MNPHHPITFFPSPLGSLPFPLLSCAAATSPTAKKVKIKISMRSLLIQQEDQFDHESDEEIVYGDGGPLYADLQAGENKQSEWKSSFDSLKGLKSLKEKYVLNRQSSGGSVVDAKMESSILSIISDNQQASPVKEKSQVSRLKGSSIPIPLFPAPAPAPRSAQAPAPVPAPAASRAGKKKGEEKPVFIDDKPSHWKQNSKHVQLLGQQKKGGGKRQRVQEPLPRPLPLPLAPAHPLNGSFSFAPAWLQAALPPTRARRGDGVMEISEDISPSTPLLPPPAAPLHLTSSLSPHSSHSHSYYPYQYDHDALLADPHAPPTPGPPVRTPSRHPPSSSRPPKVGSLRWRYQKLNRELEAAENFLYTISNDRSMGGLIGGLQDPRSRSTFRLVGEVLEVGKEVLREEVDCRAFISAKIYVEEVWSREEEERKESEEGGQMEVEKEREIVGEDEKEEIEGGDAVDGGEKLSPEEAAKGRSTVGSGETALLLVRPTIEGRRLLVGQRIRLHDYTALSLSSSFKEKYLPEEGRGDGEEGEAAAVPRCVLLSSSIYEVL